MRTKTIELIMACLLLACAVVLSREAAYVADQTDQTSVILVDAGHGGADPGMVGTDQLLEKDLNLLIAAKLKDYLEQAGYMVVMSREEDRGLYAEDGGNKKAQDMQKRCQLIEKYRPVLTVSIHQNSYPDPSVNGPQVFYYETSREGEALAACIQQAMNTKLQVKRPRTEKGNSDYYLLKKGKGIINIVECGFLTNPEEASKLQKESYQKQIAKAICEGIVNYLQRPGNLHDNREDS